MQLRDWWSELLSFGRHFGYHVNAAKIWLVIKPEHLALAQHICDGTGIQITSAGRPYLGAPLGSHDFIADYTRTQVSQWVQGLSQLSSVTVTQPHAANAVLIHGFSSKWNYYLRINPIPDDQISTLEHAIHHKFLSAIVSHPPMTWRGTYLVFPLGVLEFVILIRLPKNFMNFHASCLVLWLI